MTISLRQSGLLPDGVRVAPRRSLADEAADTLRELILLGKLAPGIAIPERELSEGLGVSRTPLKEALRKLENEGLVEYGPTRRPRVADPSFDELSDNLKVLGALEALAGELACLHATDDEIEQSRVLCERMTAAPDDVDPLELFKWDMEFHRIIVVSSRNQPLIDTHSQYNARLWRARFISSQMRAIRDDALGQHIDIVEALSARDGKLAGRQMRRHLETTVKNIKIALDNI